MSAKHIAVSPPRALSIWRRHGLDDRFSFLRDLPENESLLLSSGAVLIKTRRHECHFSAGTIQAGMP